ncbi:anti-sigma factor domain-containing protein [Amycolatopsis vancoresmycina]|uniref:Anti-sigma k factor rska n=1 Tax=Amycolatopsis vancoresmycina DSM 44592 TaxID=1292037 RepID=R1HJU4_9PSEU|nr:anti-sigma factor [Amycolatopsis vancoresmycina]EOD63840.1 anti-sigma k factor rska [Amycolatopsis vancoresmycina DSM 44592]
MKHPDPDRLVLLALDEQPPGPAEAAHLDSCPDCRDEVESLREVAALGRESRTETSLPPVSEAVWDRIAAGTGQPRSENGTARVLPPPGDGRSAGRRFRRGARYAAVAAAAAAIGVAGTALAVNAGDGGRVVAEAQLARQSSAPAGAGGQVRIVDAGEGALRLKVQLTGMPAPAGLYEIWLFDGSRTMIPLGVTAGSEADVAVPATLTWSRFPVVDVSAQELGQQEHGVSMLQGTLRP